MRARRLAPVAALAAALAAGPCLAAGDKADAKAYEAGDPSDRDARNRLDAQEQVLQELRKSLERTERTVNANAAAIATFKTLLEEHSAKVYERLSTTLDDARRLKEFETRLQELELKAGIDAQRRARRFAEASADDEASPRSDGSNRERPSASPTRAADGAENAGGKAREPWIEPIGSILAALLLFAGPAGFTLLEGARLESWALAPAALRNLLVWSVMFLAYFVFGYGIMFGVPDADWFAPFAQVPGPEAGGAESFRLYQLGMAGTFGLIVAALLSDRVSLPTYLYLACICGALVYPIEGHWIWSGQLLPENPGWLEERGFVDFAGAAALALTAASFALAWVWKFPEIRPFDADGETAAHRPVLGIWAIFALYLCWLGMAGGRPGPEDRHIALLAVNVALAVAAAVAVGFVYSLMRGRRSGDPDAYGAAAAGALAGWAAVAAAIDALAPVEALAAGAVAGLLQPRAYRLLTRHLLREDRVAASLIAALGAGGLWGTLCAGLLGPDGAFAAPDWASVKTQALGAASLIAFGLGAGYLSAWALELWRGVWALFGSGERR